MKRKLSFVICLMLLVISLCACGANKHSGGQYKAFTAYIDGSLPEGSGQKVRADRILMTVKPEDLLEPRKSEISVSVLGKQYSAAYAGKDTVGYGIAGYKYETAQGDKLEVDSAGNIMQYKSAAAYDHAERYVTADEALSPEASLAKAREYLVQLFGKDVDYVSTTVGPEQEYFLIKKEDYEARQDLILTGRTLFGAPSAKGQELEEHYFGVIRPEVSAFMKELDEELWKLGVPAKTKHNEVAPCQHELAPIFDTTNVAIDHNLLTMELMKKIAPKYGLVCLQHEKPFEGVNGSGKHNNWSMSTSHENLLDPGDTPMENLQFLVFLAAVIKAVDEYADLLRTSVATPGNDHRLGANEAPPAIISIFVGEELEAVIDAIASDSPYAGPVKMKMDLGVDVLPKFSKDTTDRNRTSPFAFTGNKFEFRMPGSAENLSDCNTILNTAVAKELKGYADELEGAEDFTSAAIALIKRTIRDHRRVIFNGNGYTAEWEAEAAKRGLPNKKNTPAALPALVAEKNIKLMEDFGVLTKVEMESRYEVEMEHYAKIINIEALTMLEMARKQLLPAVNAYMSEVANTAASKLAVSESISVRSETKTLTKLSDDADAMSDAIDTLQQVVDAAEALTSESEKAVAFHDTVIPAMDALRAAADAAETICGEDYWPLPSYSKMLYYV